MFSIDDDEHVDDIADPRTDLRVTELTALNPSRSSTLPVSTSGARGYQRVTVNDVHSTVQVSSMYGDRGRFWGSTYMCVICHHAVEGCGLPSYTMVVERGARCGRAHERGPGCWRCRGVRQQPARHVLVDCGCEASPLGSTPQGTAPRWKLSRGCGRATRLGPNGGARSWAHCCRCGCPQTHDIYSSGVGWIKHICRTHAPSLRKLFMGAPQVEVVLCCVWVHVMPLHRLCASPLSLPLVGPGSCMCPPPGLCAVIAQTHALLRAAQVGVSLGLRITDGLLLRGPRAGGRAPGACCSAGNPLTRVPVTCLGCPEPALCLHLRLLLSASEIAGCTPSVEDASCRRFTRVTGTAARVSPAPPHAHHRHRRSCGVRYYYTWRMWGLLIQHP